MFRSGKSALLFCAVLANQLIAQIGGYNSLVVEEITFGLPEIKTELLDNGIKIFHVDDNSSPLINIYILLKYSSTSNSRISKAIQYGFIKYHHAGIDSLQQTGAEIYSTPIEGGLLFTFSILSEYSDVLLGFIENSFSNITIPEPLPLTPSGKKEPVQASELADIEFDKRLFDDDSATTADIPKNIIDTLKIVVGIAGQIDLNLIKSVVGKLINNIVFENIIENCESYSKKYAGTQNKIKTISRLKTDYLRMGYLVPGICNDNYFALLIANEILDRRLLYQLRMKKGLLYQISSNYLWSEKIGKILISSKVDPDKTSEVTDSVNSLLTELAESTIDTKDFTIAKTKLQYDFLRLISNVSLLLKETMQFEAFDLPDDFIVEYFERIEKTMVYEVQKIFKENLNTNNLVTVILSGNKSN